MTHLRVTALITVVAAVVWIIRSKLREAGKELASVTPWPWPDGNVMSYGEVWDFPDAAA